MDEGSAEPVDCEIIEVELNVFLHCDTGHKRLGDRECAGLKENVHISSQGVTLLGRVVLLE